MAVDEEGSPRKGAFFLAARELVDRIPAALDRTHINCREEHRRDKRHEDDREDGWGVFLPVHLGFDLS